MTRPARQESLDPENRDEMRALAYRIVDDAITYLEKVGELPVWQAVPEDIAARLERPAPLKLAGAEAVYQEFLETIFPYPMGNIHPRFWGWYMGNGTVLGAPADFIAATMNPNHRSAQHDFDLLAQEVVRIGKELMA